MKVPGRWVVEVVMVAGVGLAGALGPSAASAQAISVGGGASSYDLSGTGTSWVAAARFDGPVWAGLRWQAGLSVFRYETQSGEDVTLGLPEAGVEWHLPLARVPLYVGAGAGYSLESGDADDAPTLYGAVGLDLELARGWGVRPEVRVRIVDPWVGTMGDFTLAVRLHLG